MNINIKISKLNKTEYCLFKNFITELNCNCHYQDAMFDDTYIFYDKDTKIYITLDKRTCRLEYKNIDIEFQKFIFFKQYIVNIKYFLNKIRKLKYNKLLKDNVI